MPIQGFDHYNLRAPRALLDQLRDFYTEVIGLAAGVRPPFASHGYWLYAGDRPVLHLSEAREGEMRPSGVTNTFDHAAFRCSDRIEFERRLSQRGIDYETAHVPQTGQVQLFLRDPAGNGVELNFLEAAQH